jgi:RNA polymerase sigma-70 factor (ECF subfamily)
MPVMDLSRNDPTMPPNPTLFDRLIREHARLIAAAIRRVCGRRHGGMVADIQQEVYLALWKRLRSPDEITHPTSYLYKMALRTALTFVRKLDPERALPAEPIRGGGAQKGRLNTVERARLVDQTLETLEPEEARALRAYMAGLNHRQVARLCGWTESVARHRIYRSLQKLREKWGP